MKKYTESELEDYWKNILADLYDGFRLPRRNVVESGVDSFSIPTDDSGTDERVFERKNGEPWHEVAYIRAVP